jgi:hypothetical protein
MTPELRQKYVMLLGQHTNATDQPPPKTKSEKQAVDVPLDELSPEFKAATTSRTTKTTRLSRASLLQPAAL